MSSRRQYLTQPELAEYADITIIDPDEADDQISQAEELIDSFVGNQHKFFAGKRDGMVASVVSSTQFYLQSDHQNNVEADYYTYCEVEIIGGAGIGQRRIISSSTYAGLVTVNSAFTTALDTTSVYRIYQLGKFPRHCDSYYHTLSTPYKYYKQIPEAVKRAVAAQVEYVIQMGESFFSSDQADKTSESIGDYSYSNGGGGGGGVSVTGTAKFIAPKARMLLRGIKNITGKIV